MVNKIPDKVHNKDGPKLPLGSSYLNALGLGSQPYVDKTLLVEEFLHGPKMALVLRPRRFGKSINLSMLSEFFSI
jgi:Predicted AAA-ATPase